MKEASLDPPRPGVLGSQEELVLADPTLPRFVFWDGSLFPLPSSLKSIISDFWLMSWPGKIRCLCLRSSEPGCPGSRMLGGFGLGGCCDARGSIAIGLVLIVGRCSP